MMNPLRKSACLLALLAVFIFLGCGSDGPVLAPASGSVLFEGEPLSSGSVMFQPKEGRHSRANIQPDGTFVMSTVNEGDGATVGQHMVRVTSSQKPIVDAQGEELVGRSLIPKKYSNFRTSGITVDVPPEGTDSISIELKKKK